MNQKTYVQLTVFIFCAIGVLHGLRLLYSWPAYIGGWVVPLGPSWVALILSVILAWSGMKLLKR